MASFVGTGGSTISLCSADAMRSTAASSPSSSRTASRSCRDDPPQPAALRGSQTCPGEEAVPGRFSLSAQRAPCGPCGGRPSHCPPGTRPAGALQWQPIHVISVRLCCFASRYLASPAVGLCSLSRSRLPAGRGRAGGILVRRTLADAQVLEEVAVRDELGADLAPQAAQAVEHGVEGEDQQVGQAVGAVPGVVPEVVALARDAAVGPVVDWRRRSMHRNSMRPSSLRLPTRDKSGRSPTAAIHWNVDKRQCNKKSGRPPIRRGRDRGCLLEQSRSW